MKRIKRKQLKKDELVTTVGKIVRFAKKREKELIAVGTVIVVIVLVFVGSRLIKIKHAKNESRLISQILELSSGLKTNSGNIDKLEKLKNKGKFSPLAYIFLANYWLERGDFDRAEKSLQKISVEKKSIFYYQAQDLLAQIYYRQKDFDKAIKIYRKLERENLKEYPLDAILFHQAEVLEQKGNIDEALALYKRIKDEFSQTYFGYDASQKVAKLETKK